MANSSLSPFYKFPEDIRKLISTTNIIEGVHRQICKVTETKSAFPSNSSLEKMLYLNYPHRPSKCSFSLPDRLDPTIRWITIDYPLCIIIAGNVISSHSYTEFISAPSK
jgi:Transposase and inactivated derivatives